MHDTPIMTCVCRKNLALTTEEDGLGERGACVCGRVYYTDTKQHTPIPFVDNLVEQYPRLKDCDRARLERYWGTLARLAPTLMRDPAILASALISYASLDHVSIESVDRLLKAEARLRKLNETRR